MPQLKTLATSTLPHNPRCRRWGCVYTYTSLFLLLVPSSFFHHVAVIPSLLCFAPSTCFNSVSVRVNWTAQQFAVWLTTLRVAQKYIPTREWEQKRTPTTHLYHHHHHRNLALHELRNHTKIQPLPRRWELRERCGWHTKQVFCGVYTCTRCMCVCCLNVCVFEFVVWWGSGEHSKIFSTSWNLGSLFAVSTSPNRITNMGAKSIRMTRKKYTIKQHIVDCLNCAIWRLYNYFEPDQL